MGSMLASFLASVRKRPRVLAASGVLLGSVALAGGLMAGKANVHAVDLTSQPLVRAEAPRPRPPAPPELQSQLETLAAAYKEPVGIAVMDLADGWIAEVNGEELFPQQSVSKLWVALSTLQAVDAGETTLDRVVTLGPDDRSVFYQPLGRRIGNSGLQVSIAELLKWALTESDNSANDKLIRELGGPDRVTEVIADKRLGELRVGAYERDLQAQIAGMTWQPDYGLNWNFQFARERLPNQVRDDAMARYLDAPMDGAAPGAIVRALAALQRGELLSPASTQVMIDLLHQCRTGPQRLKAGLPKGWELGHKTGTGQDWRGYSVGINDVGLMTAPDGRIYAVAVMMRKTAKPIWARQQFFHSVSRAVAGYWDKAHTAPPADQVVAEGRAASEPAL